MATGIRPNADPTVANWYNPDFEPQECYPAMEFRLVYDGPLKCASKDKPRVPEKHAIRKQIHKQLSLLYDNHPSLRSMRHYVYTEGDMAHKVVFEGTGYLPEAGKTMTQAIARNYVRANGFEFVPLVNKAYSLICGLDIVFLRRENPGDLLVQGGDIDNRIKTLFDALRIPEGTEIPRNETPELDERPMYCLLENDSLVTDLKVTTDRLLRPLRPDEHEHNVVLVMHVTVRASQVNGINLALM